MIIANLYFYLCMCFLFSFSPNGLTRVIEPNYLFLFEFGRMFPMCLSLQNRLLAEHVGLQDLSLLAL